MTASASATDRFPRSSTYNPDWLLASVSGAANPLWLAEWLAEALDLRPGMRVLDLGCGRATSSIFLHREFGVQVWATDFWFNVSENFRRIRDAGAEDGVFPIHADARSLPFAAEFFDTVVALDSFSYFGTDDLYLNYLARLVKPGGRLAIAGAGFMQEPGGLVPPHLKAWWTPDLWCLHSAPWWRDHWARTGIVDVELADTLPQGWRFWYDWLKVVAPTNVVELNALETDAGRYLGYVRALARRRNAPIAEPILSMPTEYQKRPVIRVAADQTADRS